MRDPGKAQAWVKLNVQSHLSATKITCIFVGNEVLTFNDTSLSDNLLSAMQSVHAELVSLGIEKQVTVTTIHSLAALETSYPPSARAFRGDLVDCLSKTLSFHQKSEGKSEVEESQSTAVGASPADFRLWERGKRRTRNKFF